MGWSHIVIIWWVLTGRGLVVMMFVGIAIAYEHLLLACLQIQIQFVSAYDDMALIG
jgi:hypothetical protein